MKSHIFFSFVAALVLALFGTVALMMSGCTSVTQMGTAIAQEAGVLTTQQVQSINRSAEALEKSFKDITPEQEYYIGRSVAATVLETYKPYDNAAANRYLNIMGQMLALYSDKPETFGGYHFLIMETEDVNAFSAPGGLVMISRGLIKCCTNEDALAAVLAHEIGHVELQHGLKAIKKGRMTSALTILAVEAGKNLGGEDLAQVTEAFEGTISDITSTLMNSGYARASEFEADDAAVAILKRVGYDPQALVAMLEQMKKYLKPGGHDFAQTHPPPADRIKNIAGKLSGAEPSKPTPKRQERFTAAVGSI